MDEVATWTEDPPYLRTTLATGDVVEVLLGGEDPDLLTSPLDFTVIRPSGARFSGTAVTPTHLEELMRRWAVTGEHGGGSYVVMPDLVVLRRPTLVCLLDAVSDLLSDGALERYLMLLDEPDPSAD